MHSKWAACETHQQLWTAHPTQDQGKVCSDTLLIHQMFQPLHTLWAMTLEGKKRLWSAETCCDLHSLAAELGAGPSSIPVSLLRPPASGGSSAEQL